MREREIGAIFWAGRDPRETLRELKGIGVRCGQLGLPGDYPLEGAAEAWRAASAEEGFPLTTVVCAFTGEKYTDIPTVERTVGFIPPATRAEREARTIAACDLAAAVGVTKGIGTHIGFVPEDREHPDYVAVRDMVRRICDHAAHHKHSFALETGQEPAPVLKQFLADVDRPNLGINFDPANMILYGTGDPIEALDLLAPHVLTVHCKDGDWPPTGVPGALGTERPLGQGSVGIPRYVEKLKQIGYTGPLHVERETDNAAEKLRDMQSAVTMLEGLRA